MDSDQCAPPPHTHSQVAHSSSFCLLHHITCKLNKLLEDWRQPLTKTSSSAQNSNMQMMSFFLITFSEQLCISAMTLLFLCLLRWRFCSNAPSCPLAWEHVTLPLRALWVLSKPFFHAFFYFVASSWSQENVTLKQHLAIFLPARSSRQMIFEWPGATTLTPNYLQL